MAIFTVPVTIGMADYRHRWPSARMTISTDGYLHGSCNHQHGELSARMATGMAPVTIGIDGYLHGSCNHQHGELSA